MHCYQPRPTGQRARHLNTLVALICGVVGGQRAHLATMADHAPRGGADQESVITRCRRWLKHDATTLDGWFLPVAKALLATLASQPLVLDGSVVGQGCLALMRSVVSQGRALPLVWLVVKGQQGRFPQATHGALLEQRAPLIPPNAAVTLLGDGEFDGTALQAAVRKLPWSSVCRTAPTLLLTVYGQPRPSGHMAPTPGDLLAVRPAWRTAAQYGPVSILAIGEARSDAPRYLVTNMAALDAALALYRQRAHIETCFADQQRRGFHLHQRQRSAPQRLARLLLAACLAYIWVVYLGVWARRADWLQRLQRQDRCALSRFRLGLRLVARCLKEAIPIPDGFLVPVVALRKPVRQVLKHAA